MTGLAEIISEARGALGIGVEVPTYSIMLVQFLTATTTSLRMCVSCITTASEA
jgi:hypothetical protein